MEDNIVRRRLDSYNVVSSMADLQTDESKSGSFKIRLYNEDDTTASENDRLSYFEFHEHPSCQILAEPVVILARKGSPQL